MQTDFIIIGSGISGLNFALHAAQKGKVIIVTKKKILDSNTNFAQGGIAAVLNKTDNFKKHIKDTLEAGAYHNNKKAVEFMVKNAPAAIHRLIELGVQFEKEKGELKLTKEGGHKARRIAYVGDHTGKEIEHILVKRVKEHPNITILENTFALKLMVKGKKCYGTQVIHKNKIQNLFAYQTILATGGAGNVYPHTTNPSIATGDGIAMGIQAGCKIKNMEFIQFHPTALNKKTTPLFLISETVRGEGGKLVNSKGEYFMEKRHSMKDLACRNIVAKEIYKELKKGPVYIDIRKKSKKYLQKRFPQIYEKLYKKYKIRMEKDLIPVTPAAHYLCGGIITNLKGETGIKNLFAFGEVTCTGVHGANRLASNSLLEALVFSNQIAKSLERHIKTANTQFKKEKLLKSSNNQTKLILKIKNTIQKLMWKYAGIVRNRSTIKTQAIPKLKSLIKGLNTIKGTNQKIAETKNIAQLSLLILQAAYKRKKSLGCHYLDKK